ncbi:TonB-dependent receptor [Xinfangfangia sp. D13-10-4-6]|uniref:TonB-dependent receptor domain-containing protein n=1 Tax=Pseudogemmobacter hezensis TaxID=2737662 RepID=UPI001554BF05|nr:TonB-dependent receptor [Pseudogemmobacter hezensis]NPD16985.1 TonB-dependent receptor [Pseudogemmobacter hezensis]
MTKHATTRPTARAELLTRLPVWTLALALTLPQLAGQAQAQTTEEEEEKSLGTIVLTATGQAQALPDAPATITVINGDDIASKPYATIADVLRNVPGVIVSSPSARSGAETISIRGLGESYVLTLVNGKPIGNSQEATYNGFGSGLAMSYLPPPSAIERIEVIRGPMSSLYGTAASGGVINVITKPVADVWSGSMTLGHSSYNRPGMGNSHEGRFYLSGPIIANKLGLAFFGSLHDRSKPAIAVSSRGNITYQSQDTDRKTLGAKLTWAIDDTQGLDFEVVSSSSDTVNQTVGGTPGGVSVDRMNYALGHKITWGDGYETNSFVTYEDVDFENGNNVSGYSLINLNSKTNLSLGRHDLTLGFDYRDETTKHSPNRVNVDPKMTRWNWALFGEDNFHLTDDLTITFGLRYDENERYGNHITPRLYAVWHASDALTIKGGVSGGYKTPTLKQADSNIFEPSGGDGRARDQGNSNLKPEESTNFEIGAIWESESGVQVGLTAYHTRFKNKIATQQICAHDTPVPGLPTNCGMNNPTDPIKWINQYVNRDAAELNGVEATVDWTLGDVDFAFNYTYADSKVTKGNAVGSRFNNSPLHVANLGIDWQATDALSVWGNAQYRSSTYDSGAGQIKEHALFDIGLDYNFNDNVMGSVAVYNVDNKVFGTTGYNDGRRFFVGLTSTF